MAINFNCSNIIIVRYHGGGSGGEFLKNCLSLSDNSVIQNTLLANLQLDGKLTYDMKVDFLNSQISNNIFLNVWDDMKLFSDSFIGYNFGKSKNFVHRTQLKLKFSPIMDRLTNKQEKYFFIKIHEYDLTNYILKLFPNAKIIEFTNEPLLVMIRNCNNDANSFFAFIFWYILEYPEISPKIYEKWKHTYVYPEPHKKELINMVYFDFLELLKNQNIMKEIKNEYEKTLIENIWNNIGNSEWPNCPKYIREYMGLNPKLRNTIQNKFNDYLEYLKFFNNDMASSKFMINQINIGKIEFMKKYQDKIVYTWDTNWYFSLEDTLKGFKELYELLGLDNYNKDSLSLLYNSWIDKMDEMKKFQLLGNNTIL